MVRLGVNIDHVATLRQARRTYEPDPVWAAAEAQLGGADCITVQCSTLIYPQFLMFALSSGSTTNCYLDFDVNASHT